MFILADLVSLIGALGGKRENRQNIGNEILFRIQLHGHTPLVCWYLYHRKPTFERKSMFQHRGNNVLK